MDEIKFTKELEGLLAKISQKSGLPINEIKIVAEALYRCLELNEIDRFKAKIRAELDLLIDDTNSRISEIEKLQAERQKLEMVRDKLIYEPGLNATIH
jgi:hypothetical protein